jgi:hypothetical protein
MHLGGRSPVATLPLVLALAASSCSGLEEAYSDRVCWGEDSGVLVECRHASIDFGCREDIETSLVALPRGAGRLATNHTRDPSAPVVGQFFQGLGTPILVKNGSPWVTLHNDIDRILRQSGYEIDHAAGGAENRLDLDFTRLDVRSDNPGLLDLTMKTRAVAAFSATLRRASGEAVWSEDFTGGDEIEVAYAHVSDSEKVLNRAYCQALRTFAAAITRDDFVERLGRE